MAKHWAQELSEEVPRLSKMHDELEHWVKQSQLKNIDPRQARLILREKELLKELVVVMKSRLNLLLDKNLK